MEHEVLIGTVKNRLQLEVNLNEKFYHIPEAVIPKDMLPVKYIALYLPANVFGENSGTSIFFCGNMEGKEKRNNHILLNTHSK